MEKKRGVYANAKVLSLEKLSKKVIAINRKGEALRGRIHLRRGDGFAVIQFVI